MALPAPEAPPLSRPPWPERLQWTANSPVPPTAPIRLAAGDVTLQRRVRGWLYAAFLALALAVALHGAFALGLVLVLLSVAVTEPIVRAMALQAAQHDVHPAEERNESINATFVQPLGDSASLSNAPGTDMLTGLPNRQVLLARLQQVMAHASRHPGYGFAVLFMDIDHFKRVNDSLGHAAGDELLRQVAQRQIGRASCRERVCSTV